MKKLLIVPAVIIAMLAGSIANAVAEPSFSDVGDDTSYASSISWMADNGVIQGYPDGTFGPDKCVNRAEFLKMLYLTRDAEFVVSDGLYGIDTYKDRFSDAYPDQWYWPYVNAALEEGLIIGYPDGTFRPGQCVNRVEAIKMATLAWNQFDEGAGQMAHSDANPRDVYSEAWYIDYFYSAFDKNAVGTEHMTTIAENSMPESYFYPGDSMTRKEVAEMLFRMSVIVNNDLDEYSANKPPVPINYYVSPNTGVSFMMPAGWSVQGEYYYETTGGVTADYPTILFDGPSIYDEELITMAINQRQMDCGNQPFQAKCVELSPNYSIGVYDPDLAMLQMLFLIELTFREPADGPVFDESYYFNQEFHLAFDIPEGWEKISEEVSNLSSFDRLTVVLENDSLDDLRMTIQTPPLETGYENSIISEGITRDIDGLTANKKWFATEADSPYVWAYNSYYIDEADWQSNIEFFYGAPNSNEYDGYLADYYELLDSVEFSNSTNVAFDGCGTVENYSEEEWFTDFITKWDAYVVTLDGSSPEHDPIFSQNTEGCLALDGSQLIFIPNFFMTENGCKDIFKYDIESDYLSRSARDNADFCPDEFGPREGAYIEVYGVDDYYGCQYTAGNYYYNSNYVYVSDDSCRTQ